uniref:Uncharacterized protein n=1 Tax=Arundo donax TaxID=35708 RepID=A0A0A9AY50_ARUDO
MVSFQFLPMVFVTEICSYSFLSRSSCRPPMHSPITAPKTSSCSSCSQW